MCPGGPAFSHFDMDIDIALDAAIGMEMDADFEVAENASVPETVMPLGLPASQGFSIDEDIELDFDCSREHLCHDAPGLREELVADDSDALPAEGKRLHVAVIGAGRVNGAGLAVVMSGAHLSWCLDNSKRVCKHLTTDWPGMKVIQLPVEEFKFCVGGHNRQRPQLLLASLPCGPWSMGGSNTRKAAAGLADLRGQSLLHLHACVGAMHGLVGGWSENVKGMLFQPHRADLVTLCESIGSAGVGSRQGSCRLAAQCDNFPRQPLFIAQHAINCGTIAHQMLITLRKAVLVPY